MNHAISDIQPPGSTYKAGHGIGRARGQEARLNNWCSSKPYVQSDHPFLGVEPPRVGPLDIKDGFAHSADTVF